MACSPSMTGIRTSISTTSGSRCRAWRHRVGAVGGLADDLQTRLGGEHRGEPLAHHRLVVRDQAARIAASAGLIAARRAGAPRIPRTRRPASARPTATRRAAPPARASRSARGPGRSCVDRGAGRHRAVTAPITAPAARSAVPAGWRTGRWPPAAGRPRRPDRPTRRPRRRERAGSRWTATPARSGTRTPRRRRAPCPAPRAPTSRSATPARRAASTSAGRSASCGCGASRAGWSWRSTPSSRRISVSASRATSLSEPNSARTGSGSSPSR